MTPKEKAKELVEKFDLPSGLMSIERKQCALIAVDEIIQSNPTEINEKFHLRPYTSEYMESSVNYWQQVKQEIEKL